MLFLTEPQADLMSSHAQLQLIKKVATRMVAPVVTSHPQDREVEESEPVTFTCQISGEPGRNKNDAFEFIAF